MRSSEIIVKIEPETFPPSTATATDARSSFNFDAGGESSPLARREGLTNDEEFTFQRTNSGRTSSASPATNAEDPPSRLIGQFLEQQRATGELCLDMDLEMEELRQDTRRTAGLPPLPRENRPNNRGSRRRVNSTIPSPVSQPGFFHDGGGSRDFLRHVSFKEERLAQTIHRRRSTAYNDLGQLSSSSESEDEMGDDTYEGDGVSTAAYTSGGCGTMEAGQSRRTFQSYRDNAEVVRCTSSAAFGRVPTLSRVKTTRSRMMDPPPDSMYEFLQSHEQQHHQHQHHPQARSGQMWSGFLGGGGRAGEEATEEEDPFMEDDLPKYRRKQAIGVIVVLEWLCLVVIVILLACTLASRGLRRMKLWRLLLWKWEVTVLALICGRLVAGGLIKFTVFVIERKFTLRKRVLYFVYGLKKAMRNCIWLGFVLLTWHLLFGRNKNLEARYTGPRTQLLITYVTKILVCFLVGSIIWLIKTLVVKILASSFHVNTFFERIQETLFNMFVIETLSGPPLYELHRAEEEEDALTEIEMTMQSAGATMPHDLKANVFPSRTASTSSKKPQLQTQPQHGRITLDNLHKLDQKNVSAWKMKRLMNIVRRGAINTLDDHLDSAAHLNETSKQFRSEVEAKAAARKIFHNVARPKSRFIYSEDLMRFMQEGDVLKTLSMFENGIKTERISKSALRNWMVNAFRERRALSLTLTDTKSAVIKLHRMVNILVSVIISIIWLIILDVATSQFLVFASSQVVLVAFIFGNSCKNVFESIIFLFVIHPYDVGDRVEIDTIQMVVEEMNIWTTVFLRYDNHKIIIPNYILFMKPIGNFNRSPDMGDAVEFCCHIVTPPEKLSQARQRILSYIENKKEHWYPNPMIILRDVEKLDTIRIAIWLQHRMNFQDMGERFGRRALLVEECIKIFRELDIEYRVFPRNINVRAMPGLSFNSTPSNWPNNPPPPPSFNMGLPESETVHR